VNFRAVHTYPLPRPEVRPTAPPAGPVEEGRLGERRAYFPPDGFTTTAVFERARLPIGGRVAGPAIVEQTDTTTVIPPGYAARVDGAGALRIRRE
jgi:N-methylhydantoinase A